MSLKYNLTRLVNKRLISVADNLRYQIRLGSYQSSPYLEDLGEVNTKYEISKDPEEWKYVERALPPTIIPEPIQKDKYPSGWKPQAENLLDRPYFIQRTKNHMLPVYLDITQRGLRRHTIIRKIQGDINLLEKELLEFLQPQSFQPIRSQVHEFAGFIRMNGDFVNAVKYFLEKRQF
ncbi:probable 39S ribosomal protein L49, mitochondrial [Diabrotica virgifera virgifera]|uniref:Large ribosomal subunit protein mL49 n=1 Tax=Diabrotica virgifera virgifera TaxID=50390 RepID=A0A6P7FVD8_DIAVI|nr:probable 39S ribosomal protein L49, mitochondrial [Diabrotica virgifera virgifera]